MSKESWDRAVTDGFGKYAEYEEHRKDMDNKEMTAGEESHKILIDNLVSVINDRLTVEDKLKLIKRIEYRSIIGDYK